MKQQIVIPEPCHVEWATMKQSDQGRYCRVCATQVIDFSAMPLEDIVAFLDQHKSQKVCGRYHERHTNRAGWWLRTVNTIEAVLLKLQLKKLTMVLIAALLFFSNCTRKRLTGAYSWNNTTRKQGKEVSVGNQKHKPHF